MDVNIILLKENLDHEEEAKFIIKDGEFSCMRTKKCCHPCHNLLVFQPMHKYSLVCAIFCNMIWRYTRKLWIIRVFKRNLYKILTTLCLVVDFTYFVANLNLVVDFTYFVANLNCWDFLKWPKTGYFWMIFSVLEHYAVNTLRVVESGSPRLRITKSG